MPATLIKLVSRRTAPGAPHIETRVFSGPEGQTLGLLGTLTMRDGDWQTFGAALGLGATQMKGRVKVEFVGDEHIVWSGEDHADDPEICDCPIPGIDHVHTPSFDEGPCYVTCRITYLGKEFGVCDGCSEALLKRGALAVG